MTPRSASPITGAALRATLLCPLCARPALLTATFERDGHLLVVAELQGCRHADGFGDPVLLTFEQEWQLIEAALDALQAATTFRASGSAARGSSRA
jgi:hypothetical protein